MMCRLLDGPQAKSPGLDVQCMIAMRRQYHREEQNRTGGAAMSVRARIRFEECKTENEVHGIKAREMQASGSTELSCAICIVETKIPCVLFVAGGVLERNEPRPAVIDPFG